MALIHDAALAAGAFAEEDFDGEIVAFEAFEVGARAVSVAGGDDLEALAPQFAGLELIEVRFPSFADGRGFSIARRLRCLGYQGRLRASGHVIVDQYPFARACGFDEVAIDAADAARQPVEYWAEAAQRPGWYQRKVTAA